MDMNLILASIGVFLGIILVLVIILLVAKQYLTPSGKVKLTINGKTELEVESVFNKEEPCSTSNSVLPLIFNFTLPLGVHM